LQPEYIVILDNLISHKASGVSEAIRAIGTALLYLPPDSLDFNPIKKFFSKLKARSAKLPNDTSMPYGRKSATCSMLQGKGTDMLGNLQNSQNRC
jgi:hypothetical protein